MEANLFDGDMIWLDADGHRFLGIAMLTSDAKANVVIAHGTGIHPDWGQVINPLRVGLAELGFNTLSIQMPVLPNEMGHDEYQGVFPEAPARFDAALNYFENSLPVYLVAHSLGSSMSTWYFANGGGESYSGFAGIGMGGNAAFPEADNVINLKSVQLPVLDLFGSQDFDDVLNTADDRAASQSGNKNYTQHMVPDANHFFDDRNNALMDAVSGWLNRQIP